MKTLFIFPPSGLFKGKKDPPSTFKDTNLLSLLAVVLFAMAATPLLGPIADRFGRKTEMYMIKAFIDRPYGLYHFNDCRPRGWVVKNDSTEPP